MQLYYIPEKVFFVVRVLCEVQSSSGWVSLVEGEVVLCPRSSVCDEGALDGLLDEVGDDGLGDLYPRPFFGDVGDVNPPCLVDLVELEQIEWRLVPSSTAG